MASTLPFGVQTTLPGTKFLPSKKKLVSFYLSNKIHGCQSETEAAFIPDHDLYGDQEPWEIFPLYACDPVSYDDDDDDDDAVKDFYCFTRLKKISKNRIGRTVGKGTWHAEGRPENYKVKVSGKFCDACYKRYLYRNEEDSEHHKRWSLLEFSCSALSDDVVICILRKNEAKGAGRGTSVPVPVDACPTLKRKSSDVCPIATEEPKRMRFEAECIVESPPMNTNSEISPASSSCIEDCCMTIDQASCIEDCCMTIDQTAAFLVPTEGSGSNLSDWADGYSHEEDNCHGMITDGGCTFTNLLLDQNITENNGDGSSNTSSSEHAVESPANYSYETSHASASGVEEWSVGTEIVGPEEDVIGSGSWLSDWVDSYNSQEDNCYGTITDQNSFEIYGQVFCL